MRTEGHEHGAEQFVGHDAPARHERVDGFVYAELTDAGETPIRWEQLPARLLDEAAGTFEICCVPFFAYGVALGDVVTTRPLAAHGLVDRVLTDVAQPSGHLTFRVQFLRAADPEHARVQLVSELTALGCLLEEWSPRMIAIDTSADAAPRVAEILEAGMDREGFEWERANSNWLEGRPVGRLRSDCRWTCVQRRASCLKVS